MRQNSHSRRQILTNIIHAFDYFGEPVAPLTMANQTVFRTKSGGCCGLTITVLILWFTVARCLIMINRDGAKVSQVNVGLNLMNRDSPDFDF